MVPRHLKALSKAIQPLRNRLEAMNRESDAVPEIPDVSGCDVVSDHLLLLQTAVQQLVAYINGPLARLAEEPYAEDGEAYRVAGRLEAAMDLLFSGYAAARGLDHWHAIDGADALRSVYEHVLGEIRDWLVVLDDLLDAPMAGIRRQGLPTTGPVTVPLTLELSTPPDLYRLRPRKPPESDGRGLLGSIGLMWLGYLGGNWLFGADDDD